MKPLIGIIFVVYTVVFAWKAYEWQFRSLEVKKLSEISDFLLCWRYLTCALIGVFASVLVTYFIFSDTRWCVKIGSIGAFPGFLAGAVWQKSNGKKLPDFQREVIYWTGGYLLIVFLSGIFIWLPELFGNRKE